VGIYRGADQMLEADKVDRLIECLVKTEETGIFDGYTRQQVFTYHYEVLVAKEQQLK
jgi:hypothetical protein